MSGGWSRPDSEETRASFKRALNVGTRLKCWDPETLLWFWFHFESSTEKDLFSQVQFRRGQNHARTTSISYHQHVDKTLSQNLNIFCSRVNTL